MQGFFELFNFHETAADSFVSLSIFTKSGKIIYVFPHAETE